MLLLVLLAVLFALAATGVSLAIGLAFTLVGLVIHLAFALAPFILVLGLVWLVFRPSKRREVATR
jgi:cbb3-type cytochrome oxidase subunit 3